ACLSLARAFHDDNAVQADLSSAPANGTTAKQLGTHGACEAVINAVREEHLARVSPCDQTGRDVDGISQHRQLRTFGWPKKTKHDWTAREAGAHFQAETPRRATPAVERFVSADNSHGSRHGSFAMVRLSCPRSECRQKSIADELLDHPAAARYRVDRHRQVFVDDAQHGGRIIGEALH